MATISFANLDQLFQMVDEALIAFSAQDAAASGFEYSYLTTGGDDWEFDGTGVTISGGLMTAGTINAIQLDLDGDSGATPEIIITGLSVDATSFGVGVGIDQRDSFWRAALGGGDTFDMTMADYTVDLFVTGDGANINTGSSVLGGDDLFTDSGTALTGSNQLIAGDFALVFGSGPTQGGNDTINVGASVVTGDFWQGGGTMVGGDDTIAPARLADNGAGAFQFAGDALASTGTATGGDDLIDLSAADISLVTGATTSIILAGDVINLNAGTLVGGNDTIIGSSLSEVIYGDEGNDFVGVTGGDDSLSGGGGADTIIGGGGDDILDGGAGADRLDGVSGNDTVTYVNAGGGASVNLATTLGSGDIAAGDTLFGIENVIGSNYSDTLTGDVEANMLDGDVEADTLTGGAGADTLIGGAGADTLGGGVDADNLDGGADVDIALYSDAAAAVTVNLNTGTGTGDVAQGDVLSNIENVAGGDFNDVLTGAHGVDNWVGGGFGADNLNGFSGNDTLVGGGDNDVLIGNFGADVLDGGAGVDVAVYADATARVVVRLWNGTGEGNLAQGDVLTNIENLNGSNFNDILFGADVVANWLGGGLGADYLNGLSGADTLVGGAGNDSLAGGAGGDRHDFSSGGGADRVFNFISGAGVWDVIRITGLGAALDSFAEILAATTQVGADSVINLGGGNTITLVGTLKTSLVADDFTFI